MIEGSFGLPWGWFFKVLDVLGVFDLALVDLRFPGRV